MENSAADLAELKMEGFIYSSINMNNFRLLLAVVCFCIRFSVFYTDPEVTALLIFALVMYNT